MARIRTIKPEFWTSPGMCALDPYARLLFIGSWNFADDFGLLPDDPARLRLQVLPADDVDAAALVDLLCDSGHYVRVVAPTGDRLLSIPTFGSHQKIDKRTAGKWGDPATWDTLDPTASRSIPPDPAPGMEGNGMELSSSSTDGFNKAREAPTTREAAHAATVEDVATAVARHRMQSQSTKVRNPNAWLKRCLGNLRNDDGGKWWANLVRLCDEYPAAPVSMLAAAAEGELSPYLTEYRREAS